jgi:hypothetical protein
VPEAAAAQTPRFVLLEYDAFRHAQPDMRRRVSEMHQARGTSIATMRVVIEQREAR